MLYNTMIALKAAKNTEKPQIYDAIFVVEILSFVLKCNLQSANNLNTTSTRDLDSKIILQNLK